MARYEPDTTPERKKLKTDELDNKIDSITSDGFDGIIASNGLVYAVIGDLTDADVDAISDYLGVSMSEVKTH